MSTAIVDSGRSATFQVPRHPACSGADATITEWLR
ncbi:hypothetical protein DFR71_3397 [Nocardia alba]|uniref:Uncharacterized protein n=1 Tax=Nocardia alba TaxID=225051 RepID=A0A4V2PBG4_9NOCA|nr:hypothetical protein DFR71_3397 [Nocardia alba]